MTNLHPRYECGSDYCWCHDWETLEIYLDDLDRQEEADQQADERERFGLLPGE